MKKFILILFLFAGTLARAHAQDGERIEAIKIAFLTKKLDLSPEEAQRFWPIYNRYNDEIRGIKLEQKQKGLTELEVEDKILGVRKKYNGEFGKAISAEKINTFFRSEKEFGAAIKREMQERRMERQLERKGLRN